MTVFITVISVWAFGLYQFTTLSCWRELLPEVTEKYYLQYIENIFIIWTEYIIFFAVQDVVVCSGKQYFWCTFNLLVFLTLCSTQRPKKLTFYPRCPRLVCRKNALEEQRWPRVQVPTPKSSKHSETEPPEPRAEEGWTQAGCSTAPTATGAGETCPSGEGWAITSTGVCPLLTETNCLH